MSTYQEQMYKQAFGAARTAELMAWVKTIVDRAWEKLMPYAADLHHRRVDFFGWPTRDAAAPEEDG